MTPRQLAVVAIVFVLFGVGMTGSAPTYAQPAVQAVNPPNQQPAPAAGTRLNLTHGGYVMGELRPSNEPGVLYWHCPIFVEPLKFPVNNVASAQFPGSSQGLPRDTDYCIELSGGDILFGSLRNLTSDSIELESRHAGVLRLSRANVLRMISLRESQELVYLGPNDLDEWSASPKANAWREESGHLVSEAPWSSIYADLGIPSRSYVELEVSWKKNPDFLLAVGAGVDAATRGFCFEFWNQNLVVARESERRADLAALGKFEPGPGRLKLWVFFDQQQGTVVVTSDDGRKLASLDVGADDGKLLPGVHLVNKRGDVRLERLRIGRWSGEFPGDGRLSSPRVHRANGDILYGQVKQLDAAQRQFVVATDEGDVRLDEADVSSVFLSFAETPSARDFRVTYHDGTRISGLLQGVDKEGIRLLLPGTSEPCHLPLADMNSLLSMSADSQSTPPVVGQLTNQGRIGTLNLPGYAELAGYLVDGETTAEGSCLMFQPHGCPTASRLKNSVNGHMSYRNVHHVQHVPIVQPAQPSVIGGLLQALGGGRGSAPGVVAVQLPRMLHLRTGDNVPCEVTKIDDEGVHFTAQLTETTFVPHNNVKAIVLTATGVDRSAMDPDTWRRLMTVPRMQKGNEPTHIICSKSGDYVRGRLLGMDQDKVFLESRLETIEIPRFRIAEIIWLHEDELSENNDGGPPNDGDDRDASEQLDQPVRMQAVRTNANRLTFFPKKVRDGVIEGPSNVLGNCRVAVVEVDQLLFGSAVNEAAAALTYNQFKLRPATDPRFVTAGENGPDTNVTPGTQSPLVGTPAPDFQLDLLNGQSMRLQDLRGHVVVLDFWASWCGPCIQAMPVVDSVSESFADQGVKLVAINLQESSDKITATLERLQLETTVALDRDGAVAAKYRANAIPQTVIIDRQGKIARLFVGGGRDLGEQLRQALEAVIAEP